MQRLYHNIPQSWFITIVKQFLKAEQKWIQVQSFLSQMSDQPVHFSLRINCLLSECNLSFTISRLRHRVKRGEMLTLNEIMWNNSLSLQMRPRTTETILTGAHNNPCLISRTEALDSASGSDRPSPSAPACHVSSHHLAPDSRPVISSCLKMPVTLYSDKFRSYEASTAPEYGPSPGGGGASSGHGSRSKSLKGWEVIKKAIFTPIGTKDVSVSTHRRRRSRRNLHDPREQHPDEREQRINGIQSISDQEAEDADPTNNYKRKSNQKLAPSLSSAPWLGAYFPFINLFIYFIFAFLSCVNRNPFDWMGLGTFKSWVSLKLSREIIRVRIITRPRHPVSGTIINTEATPRTRPWHITVTAIPSPSITDNTIDKVETKGLLKLLKL